MTREKILQAADQCFARKGMAYTLITDMCQEAGVSVGTFYHYFKNKDDLIKANFYEFDKPFHEQPDDSFCKEDALDNLLDFALFFCRNAFTPETQEKTIEYLKARLTITIEELRPRNRPFFKVLCRIITEGQQKRQLRTDMSPEEMGDLVMTVILGYDFDWANANGKYDLKETLLHHLPILFGSLRWREGLD